VIWVGGTQVENGSRIIDTVILKQAGQLIDLDRLAFSCVHPAAFRRLWFASAESRRSNMRQACEITRFGGYGRPADFAYPGADIYVKAMCWGEGRWDSAESAEQWLIESLKEQGVIK
jgi:hypothetical protein